VRCEQRAGTDAPPRWLAELVSAAKLRAPELIDARMRPPADGSGRDAAVLIALCETVAGPAVLLIERSSTMRTHAGQVAFPGGAVEPTDATPSATAVREAAEEVGLDPASVQVLATMSRRFLPPSGFIVTPVIGWWRHPHPIATIDAGEVARAVVVAIGDLADPANRFQVHSPRFGHIGPAFETDGLFIWGFTAALLNDLLRFGGWEQPWNEGDYRPVPDGSLP
jgi:8-oxo-dGTP pyrophosphatase MutT (NUDIX family)